MSHWHDDEPCDLTDKECDALVELAYIKYICPNCGKNYDTCPCYLPDEPIHQEAFR